MHAPQGVLEPSKMFPLEGEKKMAGSEQKSYCNAGQTYTGDMTESEGGVYARHGLGRQVVHAETVLGESMVLGRYVGAFKRDAMTGCGTYRWSDGSSYEGDFLAGKPHGHGKFTWTDGSFYDGLWEDSEMMGQGTYYNAILNHTRQGVFYRNCLRLHDGSWLDIPRQREEQRIARLQIGAEGPGMEASINMPVLRCRPGDALAKVLAVVREPPHLIPLVLADRSCPVQPEGTPKPRPSSVAPLWCLRTDGLGCTDDTTVHLAFAAAEKRRKRDVQELFRAAIREALLTHRPFVLAFGEESEGGNPQDGEAPAPACWRLSEFFDAVSLPLDLFDLRHFQGSGSVESFLPADRRGWRCEADAMPLPAPAQAQDTHQGSAEAVPEGQSADGEPVPSCLPPRLRPARTHLLHFAMASLKRIERHLQDDAVRAHVARRFAEHMPLHRVAAVVVSND